MPVEELLASAKGLTESAPIDALHTVVTELGAAFDGKGEDLQSLADRLRSSDPDVRRLIDNGNPARKQLGQLVSDAGPGITTNLANLSATAKVISVHLGRVAETNNPPSCTVG